MKKIAGLLLIIFIAYVLPLFGNMSLIVHPFVILLMMTSTVVMLTQPDMDVQEAKRDEPLDKNSFWIIYSLAVIGLIAPVIEWAYFNPLHTDMNWISILGLVFVLAGLFIRVWAIQVLSKFFTAPVQVQHDHQLLEEGTFLVIRHPSYLGAYLSYIGSGFILNAYVGTIITALAMFIGYYYRITKEEKALVSKFGIHYENYRNKTSGMLPFFW
jgi:protein-S-isoprenylcysteine O-methyltransferase Ste14